MVNGYLVNGESDAPSVEEQRAPANGWCELLRKVSECSVRVGLTSVHSQTQSRSEKMKHLRIEEIRERLGDWV